jgi:hypothetical protein
MAEEKGGGARKQVPVWRKPSKASKKTRIAASKAVRKRREAEAAGRVLITPMQSAFLAELMINGGSRTAAAKTLGIHPTTAIRWLRKPHIQAAYEHFQERAASVVEDWSALLGRAQQTLVSLLDSTDDRVRKDVAIYLVDRSLGKVSQKIDATVTHRDALTEIELQAALSLVSGHGMTLTDASRYVREHPDEVSAWAVKQVEDAARSRHLALPAEGQEEAEWHLESTEIPEEGESAASG